MTKEKLIAMLEEGIPKDAIVRIYNAESNKMEEVTGCVTGRPRREDPFFIDLHSDDIS